MSKLGSVAIRVAFCVTLGLSFLAGGVFAPIVEAQEATTASHGIVGIAIGLTAQKVGAPARLVVEHVIKGSPAQIAGVRRGDEIVTIDGKPVTGKSLRDIAHMIRGEVGTTVTLTLEHEGQSYGVSLTRVSYHHPQ